MAEPLALRGEARRRALQSRTTVAHYSRDVVILALHFTSCYITNVIVNYLQYAADQLS
jgi:hypothetical protein